MIGSSNAFEFGQMNMRTKNTDKKKMANENGRKKRVVVVSDFEKVKPAA